MFSRTKSVAAACILLTLLGVSAMAATVTVDFATQHQTIEGFGFFGPANVWWSSGPFYSETWGTTILEDLGITMWRNEYFSEEGGQDANWAKQHHDIWHDEIGQGGGTTQHTGSATSKTDAGTTGEQPA